MANLVLIILNVLFPLIALVYLAGFFLSSRKRLLANLKNELPERFGFYKTKNLKNVLWFHAASVGEVKSIEKITKYMQEKYPENPIVVTTSTYAGRQTAKEIITPNSFLAPLDFYPITSKFVKNFKPRKLFIVESEIWPNMLKTCQKNKIPVFIINARISAKSAKLYSKLKFFTKAIFSPVKAICAQTDEIAGRYISLAVEKSKIFTTGNIKYDLLDTLPAKSKDVQNIFNSLGWQACFIIVCGSAHEEEENIFSDVFLQIAQKINVKLVLAPRHIERITQIKQMLKSKNINFAMLNEIKQSQKTDCIIVNKMGWLTSFYANASVCFVGGTLVKKGGHNLLEPAILAKPIIFGQYTFNTPNVADELLLQKGALQITKENLYETIINLYKNPNLTSSIGENARKTAQSFQNATSKTIEIIENER